MKKIDRKGGKATVLWGISDKTAKVQTLKAPIILYRKMKRLWWWHVSCPTLKGINQYNLNLCYEKHFWSNNSCCFDLKFCK